MDCYESSKSMSERYHALSLLLSAIDEGIEDGDADEVQSEIDRLEERLAASVTGG